MPDKNLPLAPHLRLPPPLCGMDQGDDFPYRTREHGTYFGTVLDRKLVFGRLWACLIRSFASKDWREKTASLIEKIAFEVPCYDMAFDTSGRVAGLLDDLTR